RARGRPARRGRSPPTAPTGTSVSSRDSSRIAVMEPPQSSVDRLRMLHHPHPALSLRGRGSRAIPSPPKGGEGRVRGVGGVVKVVESRPMATFQGFTLPDELKLLGEQIRRFVQDEIIPLERTLDPDAPDIPDEDFARLAAKTKAAGLWALGAKEEHGGGRGAPH